MGEPARTIGDQVAGPLRSSPYRVQVLDRSLGILNVLAEAGHSLGPAELAGRLSLHKTTIHRLLMVLERHGLLHRDARHGKYSLGVKLFELGSLAVARFNLRERAEPFLHRLVDQTKETAHVCVLEGTETLSIVNVQGPWTLGIPSAVGRRAPVYCTSVGKAAMAFLPDPLLEDCIARLTLKRYTRKTIVTRPALRAELRRVRQRGFAIDDEELEEGLRCVGAPIRDYTGRVSASIAIAGPAYRLPKRRLPAVARAVLAAASGLSREMGYAGRQASRSEGVKG